MTLSDFDYELPEERIAQTPPAERDGARMLVIHRSAGTWRDLAFRDLPDFLHPDDCVVLNDSRVIPSRVLGVTETGARAEIFLLRSLGDLRWRALVKPGRKLLPGKVVQVTEDLSARVVTAGERGERVLEFAGARTDEELEARLEEVGHMPLPPYIHRPGNALDRARYQTVYSQPRGSVAAPTAGLHFTPEMLARLPGTIARVTLHVGLGTFQPIDREDFENHSLHAERYEVSPAAWQSIGAAQRAVAIGTTSVRTIESVARTGTLSGETNLFLYPEASFLKTGAMLTNFHLPRSSLLLLVCAFAGTELVLDAYRHAVRDRYSFFSYGDCMLIV